MVSRPPCLEPEARKKKTSAWRPNPRPQFQLSWSPAVLALPYFDGRGVEKSAAAAAEWARQGKTFAADMMGLEFAADRIER